jgi:hypothetical protein
VVFFLLMGVGLAALGGTLSRYLVAAKPVIALILVGAGVATLANVSLPVPQWPRVGKALAGRADRRRPLSSLFLNGFGYGLASTGCTLPIYVGLVVFPLSSGVFVRALLAFVSFALALGGLMMLLTVVALPISGCSASPSREEAKPKVVRPGDMVAVQGPAPTGRFFIKAGAESLDSDLYEVTFAPVGYERITTDARVTTVGGCAERVVVAAAQKKVGYVDTLQELRDGVLEPVDKLGLEIGSDPDLFGDCRILFSKTTGNEPNTTGEIKLFDAVTGATSTVTSGPTVEGASWGPHGEVLVLRREPTGPKLDVIRPDGSRTDLDPKVPDVGNTPWGKGGWIAMAVFNQAGQPPTATLFLNPSTGQRSSLEGWLPLDWSPVGDQLLVRDTKKGTTLAVVETADLTKARAVGVSEAGTVWDAVWLPA